MIVPSSLMYPMPYAWFLASWSHMFLFLLLTLHSPLLLLVVLSGLFQDYHLQSSPLGSVAPFYLGYSPIESWDSLSGYVHPGIACLAFLASDWLGAFWASLSDFPPFVRCPSNHDPSVKLIMIGHCCDSQSPRAREQTQCDRKQSGSNKPNTRIPY